MNAQVLVLFLCDTINCCFDVAFLYIPLVNNFGRSRSQLSIPKVLMHNLQATMKPSPKPVGVRSQSFLPTSVAHEFLQCSQQV